MIKHISAIVLAQFLLSGFAFAGSVGPIRVPEPTTMALLAAGVGGLAVLRKFRNRK